jgi:lipid-binding SYLF domain-containing protein
MTTNQVQLPRILALALAAGSIALGTIGCDTAPKSASDKQVLSIRSGDALTEFKRADPSLQRMLDKAYGYAIFPSVGKGAVGVGGAYGRGEVYEGNTMVGYCDLSQGTIGFQLGGQEYMELIVFETKAAIDQFKSNTFEFSGQASAVAVRAGAAATAPYENGVAVFTATKGGLMFEASVGGQRFTYQPK